MDSRGRAAHDLSASWAHFCGEAAQSSLLAGGSGNRDCPVARPSVAIIAKVDAEGMTSMARNATTTDASGL
jgi:hypothetical protein